MKGKSHTRKKGQEQGKSQERKYQEGKSLERKGKLAREKVRNGKRSRRERVKKVTGHYGKGQKGTGSVKGRKGTNVKGKSEKERSGSEKE